VGGPAAQVVTGGVEQVGSAGGARDGWGKPENGRKSRGKCGLSLEKL